jgi:hypothetical protein
MLDPHSPNKPDSERHPIEFLTVDRVNFVPGRRERSSESKHDQSASKEIISDAIKNEYGYGKLGLILGMASIIGGIILCLNGVAGSTSWTAAFFGLQSKINDAAPGVVLFIVGLFFVLITKPKVKLKDLNG